MWSRNTVRERVRTYLSSVAGTLFGEQCDGRTHNGELTCLLKWPADLSPSLERPVDLCLQSQITDLILSFQVLCGNMNILFASRIFCLYLVIGTYILPFFPVICWSYLQTEISVTLSIGNKLYSSSSSFIFYFIWNNFGDVILRPCWTS